MRIKFSLLFLILNFTIITQFVISETGDGLFLIKNNSGLNYVILSSEENSSVKLIEYTVNKEKVLSTLSFPQKLHKATKFNDKIILAFGSSIKKQKEIIRVLETDLSLKNKKEIFKKDTGRNQVSFLKAKSDGFYFNYFTDTYNTELLKFAPSKNAYTQESLYKKRMSINLDILDDESLLIGRPYGDKIGENGDAYLKSNNQITMLDTVRGVSAVKFINKEKLLLLADGWHQNYGKIAEARLTLFTLKDKEYNSKVLINDTLQYRFENIDSFSLNNTNYILASGNKNLWFIKLNKDGSLKKKLIAKKADARDTLKAYFLGVQNNKLIISILNKTLSFSSEEL